MPADPSPARRHFDVAVVGAGPSGLVAAIVLAQSGLRTALVAPPTRPDDIRTTALLGGSVTLLQKLGVWEAIAAVSAPLATMRLIDDTDRLIRAPEATFNASEIGRDAFGYNVRNADLTRILDACALATSGLTLIGHKVDAVAIGANNAMLALDSGEVIETPVIGAADGRNSMCRTAAGIDVENWTYPQSALVTNIGHSVPHDAVSTEFHTKHGPFVLVPLPGDQSSVVLVDSPEAIERLAALEPAALAMELERRSHSVFGRLTIEAPCRIHPLSGMKAKRYAAHRVALIGEAGHVFPPIGAQGLNLGLRDGAALAEVLVRAKASGADLGGDMTLAAFDSARRLDVATRTNGVDLLNRTLLSDLIPAQMLRGVGLWLANSVPPLRRLMMREGLTPSFGTPRIMRG